MQNLDRLRHAEAWMKENQSAAYDQLERWCRLNSWSHDPTNLLLMANTLCDDFSEIGVPLYQANLPNVRLLADDRWSEQPTGPALIWHHQPEADRRLLLMIHYDTVYPESEQQAVTRTAERMIGPGTADAKGGIAVIAMAIEAAMHFDLADEVGISILLNPDEEIGSSASAEIMSRIAPKFDAALVFEPTLPDGSLVANRKGSGNFCFTVHGKAAHAGRNPQDGRNAIVHMAKMIPDIVSIASSNDETLLNIGAVQGGGPLNQVPHRSSLRLNARVGDAEAMNHVESAMRDVADQYTKDEYHVSLVGGFHSPPKQVTAKIERLQRLVERAGKLAGRTIRWKDTGGACDGCKLAAMGLPNIDTMGISGGGLHSSEEYCELDSLVPAAHTVAAFIAAFAASDDEKMSSGKAGSR